MTVTISIKIRYAIYIRFGKDVLEMELRNNTKVINIGGVQIGGGNSIKIQSMTNTPTEDVAATVKQILQLEEAGCEIIRCTVPNKQAAEAIRELTQKIHIELVQLLYPQLSFVLIRQISVGRINLL